METPSMPLQAIDINANGGLFHQDELSPDLDVTPDQSAKPKMMAGSERKLRHGWNASSNLTIEEENSSCSGSTSKVVTQQSEATDEQIPETKEADKLVNLKDASYGNWFEEKENLTETESNFL